MAAARVHSSRVAFDPIGAPSARRSKPSLRWPTLYSPAWPTRCWEHGQSRDAPKRPFRMGASSAVLTCRRSAIRNLHAALGAIGGTACGRTHLGRCSTPNPQRPRGAAEVDGACGRIGPGRPSHREKPPLPAGGWPRHPLQYRLMPEAWIKPGFRSLIDSKSVTGYRYNCPDPSLGRDAGVRASSFGRGYGGTESSFAAGRAKVPASVDQGDLNGRNVIP